MIKIVESRNDFGSMNLGTINFSNLTDADKKLLCDKYNINLYDIDLKLYKKEIFTAHRQELGQEMGFDGRQMFMADQNHKSGSSFEITDEYVRENPEGWTDIPEDILVVTSKTPKVVIGHPVADCPVVMMVDRKQKISAVGHCSAEMIDMRLPEMIAETLRGRYGSKTEDIMTYVSACIGEGWTYDVFPKWAKDAGIWEHCIYMGGDGLFHISLKPAIMAQLIKSGLMREHIMFNMDDTMTNQNYYSNSMANKKVDGDPSKYGRHFAGMFFTEDDSSEIEIQKGRRK